ncbi:MAG: ABC transporter permease [Bacteroidales bacterium]|jgi:ABC-2 type transport system permease protein|nr:ABC transporter permease [Bacteroidales bacterium]
MNKIFIIIHREFLTRVRKKSFIIMTLLGPVLFASFMTAPVWFATMEDEDVRHIAVLDSSRLFFNMIPETEHFKFSYDFPNVRDSLAYLKQHLAKSKYSGVLYIPPYVAYVPSGVEFYSDRQPPVNLSMHMANALEKIIEREKLSAHHIENLDDILRSVKTNIKIRIFRLSGGGTEKESHSGLNMVVACISALLIYMFVFLFGAQVMRGVIEEKTGRIVEVIISSVKPFQLMMGKVVGIALTGLTQFVIWIVLTLILVMAAQWIFLPQLTDEALQQAGNRQTIGALADNIPVREVSEKTAEMMSMLQSINFDVIIGCFLFFFIGGYLLYASLFAAVGSAVDSETDTQQFMLPITVPLFVAMAVMFSAVQNPDGTLAFWFSVIPFTSPIVMMARISFGVPYWELFLSMTVLAVTFIGAILLSGKIYRTGILIYGKKPTWRELWKWLTYKR